MKKKLFLTAILTLICCTLLIAGASADLEGTGTADDPYQISNAVELIAFADIVNNGQNAAHAVLTANITVNENVLKADGRLNPGNFYEWTPIGTSDSAAYTGTFDGQAHTISGLYTMVETQNTTAYAGLFGCVGEGGVVKNVNIADSYIYASITESDPGVSNKFAAAGSVCGKNYGTIENCTNSGTVVVEDGSKNKNACYAGGVCGLSTHTDEGKGKIIGCANSGRVSGYGYVGGVCGGNLSDLGMENCTNSGSVSGYGRVGGVCGSTGHLTVNCGNTGSVSGSGNVGGVCGYNNSGKITNCFSTGSVSGNGHVGGVCGNNSSGSITNCFWLDTAATGGIGIGSGTATKVESKSADQFATGEVAWLLNQGQTAGPWRQNLGEGEDAEPVLDATHSEVICIYIDGDALYADPDNVTLPDPGPGKAYFDGDDDHVDPETYKFTDGEAISSKDAATIRFVYGNGTPDKYVTTTKVGSVVMPDAPSKPGYIFMGWRSGSMTYLPGDEVGVYGDTTFTAVWANIPDIKPEEPDEPDEFPFTDVTEGAWYYDAVYYVWENGLMNGTEADKFAPNSPLTRAMVWAVLARIDGVEVSGDSWMTVAQKWAVESGVSDGTNPTGYITREQFVTMLWRYKGSPAVEYTITAPDAASISDWALDAMKWAASTGLIEGDDLGNLNPTSNSTRAHAATFFMRFCKNK